MANNPYVNKVEKADGTTIMDITDTTAEENDVLSGEVFYKSTGQRSTGTLSLSGYVVGPDSATDGHIAVFDGTTGKVIKDSGHTIATDVPANAVFTDTTYSDATQSASGLMSASDKTKLDGVAAGATANVGTITGIKMNGASKGTSGVVDLGTVITEHQDISGKKNTQTAKSDPTASGTSATFIDTISQDTQGVITATKKTVRTMSAASSSAAGTTGLVPAPGSGKQASFLRGDATWAVPTDTKNTAGSTNSSSKLFLIGATSQAANPQTYSQDTAYVGTDGCLYSGSSKVITAGTIGSQSVNYATSAGSATDSTARTLGTSSETTFGTTTYTSSASVEGNKIIKQGKHVHGQICYTATINLPAGTALMTIPSAYRPAANLHVPAMLKGSDDKWNAYYAYVNSNGNVGQDWSNSCRGVMISADWLTA